MTYRVMTLSAFNATNARYGVNQYQLAGEGLSRREALALARTKLAEWGIITVRLTAIETGEPAGEKNRALTDAERVAWRAWCADLQQNEVI